MLNSPLIRRLIHLAIDEDLSFDDITSTLAVPEESRCRAQVVAKEPLVVCGAPIVPLIFETMEADVAVQIKANEGAGAGPGDILAVVEGKTRVVLSAERIILNFLQRLSGVATLTRKFVEQAGELVLLDTRKTLPGWRMLDKYAVATGGGKNHRFHLGDMILVKNNHVDSARGNTAEERMRAALKAVFSKKPVWMPVEVEVRSLGELQAAIPFKPQILMLDNMNDGQISESLAVIRAGGYSPQVEVSGSVSLDRLASLRTLGVSCVSVGALTTHAPNVDISMRVGEIG